ncbi:hypothetical protein BG011_006797 [Mortierella polycephala]|uniref:DUF4209 domain-containing protein n=1 Tax=Mortierella polycephala TaxID=41804 RepID=A0A9P6QD22_9FUNG|nr:hypothetical protein BG011_006797 [Mortierella polycephala]
MRDGALPLKAIFADQMKWMDQLGSRATEIWFELWSSGDYNQAWLVGSTVLEQLIGNIIFTLQGSSKFIPFLVRDLLAVPCLTKCIDPCLISVLKTIMGSPMTLNIRNLLWHGFIVPQDNIPLDAYGAMLIVVTMTIAAHAQKRLTVPLQTRHLEPKVFYFNQQWSLTSTSTPLNFDHLYETVAYNPHPPPLDLIKHLDDLEALVKKTRFVIPGTEQQWIAAIHHLQPESSTSFVFVMATLPLMEHALRQLYVTVNNCREDRRSALIAGEYYLTLDVILDEFVPAEYFDPDPPVLREYNPSNIPNKLYRELGIETMTLFNDLFIMGCGPRIRDRTSHGELNAYLTMDVTPEPWFDLYARLIVHILAQYMTLEDGSACTFLDENASWIKQYTTSHFDEWSVLMKEAARCHSLLSSYLSIKTHSTSKDDDQADACEWIEIIHRPKGAIVFTSIEIMLLQHSKERLLKCLSSWRSGKSKDSGALAYANNIPAWILIFQGIQFAIQKVTIKISTLSQQLVQRQLSSRARKQFESMRPQIPRLLGMLAGCLALIEHFVLAIPDEEAILRSSHSYSAGAASTPTPSSSSSSSPSPSPSPSPSTSGINSNTIAADMSTATEIQLRSRISMFVEKFVSNFDRGKMNMIEPVWEDLLKSVEVLEAKSRGRRTLVAYKRG